LIADVKKKLSIQLDQVITKKLRHSSVVVGASGLSLFVASVSCLRLRVCNCHKKNQNYI